MFKKSWMYWVVAVVVAIAFGSQAHGAWAQSTPQAVTANTIEIIGLIDAVNGTTIMVNGLTIDISRAERAALLKVGDKVKVEATLAADGSITARQVNAPQTGMQPGETELVGVVAQVNGTRILVGGQTIDISGAEVKATIRAGQTVTIEFTFDAAGQRVVREVKVTPPVQPNGAVQADAKNAFEITGTLDQIGDGFVVVSGQRIDLSQAEIKGNLMIGALVKIQFRNVAGQPVAHEIENEHPEDHSPVRTGGGRDNSGDRRGAASNQGNTGGQNSGPDDHGGNNQNSGQQGSTNSGSSNQSGDDHGGQQGGGNQGSGGGGGHDDGGGHR